MIKQTTTTTNQSNSSPSPPSFESDYTPSDVSNIIPYKGLKIGERLLNSIQRKSDWKKWGPYVSDREWSTVREDYSSDGDVWKYFDHDQARSRAYRWSEDAIGGYCNRFQNVVLGLAFWNGNDPIIKERLFGLTGPEGNHGEDVKEHYFYSDNTPDHSYCKMLYKYPQKEYPYEQLVKENAKRNKFEPEYELEDTGIFDNDEYFDIFIEYAKAAEEDILCRVTIHNRGPNAAPINVLPQLWYRNTWSWGYNNRRPYIKTLREGVLVGEEHHIGKRFYAVTYEGDNDGKLVENVPFLFTENDTNTERLFKWPNASPYVKDGINNYITKGWSDVVNYASGTKVAANCYKVVQPGESFTVKIRFADYDFENPWSDFDKVFKDRIDDADEFYNKIHGKGLSQDIKAIQRQALSGILWSKQYYHFGVEMWKKGDPILPRINECLVTRNAHWEHFYANDVISMPDKFEYPWLAQWDLCFHVISLVMVDVEWAKRQLILLTREWYMSRDGKIPAYEFQFNDVNPPVHAWAALEIYRYILKKTGHKDLDFLEEIFHKLLLNFTWWINLFESGFLGLDNISIFDRSQPLPGGGKLEQADGSGWIGFYCLNMLAISLEIAKERPAYESIATKFLEHFVYIAKAIYSGKKHGTLGLWDEDAGFFFDSIQMPNGYSQHIKLHSLVGLIPLFAVDIIEQSTLDRLPRFKERLDWFIKYRPHLVNGMASFIVPGEEKRRLLSIVNRDRLKLILEKMLDETKFLSEFGVRSLSKQHQAEPFVFNHHGQSVTVAYEPGESTTGIMGGNSSWRGSIWLCVNYLMIQSLKHYHSYYGNDFEVEFPTGSKNMVSLDVVQKELSRRLISIFTLNGDGSRQYNKSKPIWAKEHWRDHILFNEYFNGDNGNGVGAIHQGWTTLVAKLIEDLGDDL
ncbi:hypothetical protein DFA_12007 [Cavenderia fasciculata]|uniref:Glycosyl hydrolase family 63 C-terminal domain-containing protein n=1 Tax=Cavenderia fasciculata TaxID=261658 RepID=F4QF83_CACFS|nr:uncharacterized protein DFA_12007 [Cavenderia fasciculata]EGG14237.1 hypothetical protein DFA_12007 [Cavenderia fasciculata]|eukprot:XP_004350946.1 hypothetical protein DFA_12007 [Cavenderia fasciculata]